MFKNEPTLLVCELEAVTPSKSVTFFVVVSRTIEAVGTFLPHRI